MKINSKIMLLITSVLILGAGITGAIAIWQSRRAGQEAVVRIERLVHGNIVRMQQEGEKEARTFREDSETLKKIYLKDQVNTVLSAIMKGVREAEEMNKASILEESVKEAIMMEQKTEMASFVAELRYGPEGKDYFWINDLEPIMVMHPYSPELNGKNISGIKDPTGKEIFLEFVRLCQEKGEGFVRYMWPKNEAEEPQPRLSYVKLFPEWNWIVGTGVYTDDVEAQIDVRKKEIQARVAEAEAEAKAVIDRTRKETQEDIRNIVLLIVGSTLAVIILVLSGASIFARRSITRPINNIIEGLTTASDQVRTASAEISSASRSMAESASQQAASIEETSASLEEMSSMTRRNADNAAEADRIMRETRKTVDAANLSMNDLISSMAGISHSSEETSKIVKTIDEIAFQTNLLALNAAVEAARAGEAGAGFAVVADEVRNLSMRAAEAAKNTAELIKDTTQKVHDGSGLVTRTNHAFGKVAKGASKVADLVSEISAASGEQAQGIEQINLAVSEMDKSIQQNTTLAEKSDSASEEMMAQSEQLRTIVDELRHLVQGRETDRRTNPQRSKRNIRESNKFRCSCSVGHHPQKLGLTAQYLPDNAIGIAIEIRSTAGSEEGDRFR
jgi:methyl-accepting chemotaxis protein